jgi:hypothetical protein
VGALVLFSTAAWASKEVGIGVVRIEGKGETELRFSDDPHRGINPATLNIKAVDVLDHPIVNEGRMLNMRIAYSGESVGDVLIGLGVNYWAKFGWPVLVWQKSVASLIGAYNNLRTIFVGGDIEIADIKFPFDPERRTLPGILIFDLKMDGLTDLERPVAHINKEWIQPRAIGVNVPLMGFVDTPNNEKEANNGGTGGEQSDYVKRPSRTDGLFPEKPFIGAVLFIFIFGAVLSCFALSRPNFFLWLIGWLSGLVGVVLLLLWALPLIAEKIPAP